MTDKKLWIQIRFVAKLVPVEVEVEEEAALVLLMMQTGISTYVEECNQ